MTALHHLSAQTLATRLRRREISASALLEHHLERIEAHDGQTNAVVVRDAARARSRALHADAALARGQCWGLLHGLPITVKEAFDVEGLPTTWGFERWRGNVATRDAVAVQRLKQAGAIVLGKTNVPTALGDWQTFNPVYGTTRNPWNLERTPGGSSGGSAVALAAGYSALELGSDIGASIRNPAHYCGVYGHKPTWGLVPQEGHQTPDIVCPDAIDIGVAGPLGRSAVDLELAMTVLCQGADHYGPLGRTPLRWRDDGRPAPLLRVAVVTDDACAPVDSEISQALQGLAEHLSQHGFQVSLQARPVRSEELWEVYVHLLRAATGAMMDEADYADACKRAAQHPPDSREYVAWHWRGSTMNHRQWAHCDGRRARLRAECAAFFEEWDVLICPVAPTAAFAHNQQGFRWERMLQVNGQDQPTTQGLFWAGYASLCGLPATAVPLGASAEGLPFGAQLIGPVFGDPRCLRMARWLEEHWRGFVAPEFG